MTRNDVLARVAEVLRQTFEKPDLEITDSVRAKDVDGWDSLTHATIIIRLEKLFDVAIPDAVAYEVENVGQLVDSIHELVRGRS